MWRAPSPLQGPTPRLPQPHTAPNTTTAKTPPPYHTITEASLHHTSQEEKKIEENQYFIPRLFGLPSDPPLTPTVPSTFTRFPEPLFPLQHFNISLPAAQIVALQCLEIVTRVVSLKSVLKRLCQDSTPCFCAGEEETEGGMAPPSIVTKALIILNINRSSL